MTGTFILIAVSFVLLWFLFNSKISKKKAVLINLSEDWVTLLEKKVPFYQKLGNRKKNEFEKRVIEFLESVTITGINCEVEELDKILIASSALIPVFQFSSWKYPNLDEVLLYPLPFNEKFGHEDANIQGMVGNGFMSGKMILSRTSLRQGFQAELDKKNVGIHEFVHLIDGVDGKIDGIPEVLMSQQYSLPWLDLVYRKIKEMQTKNTDLNPYGATNEQEFLSVASEYFFEHPRQLKKKHPDLYGMLSYFYSSKYNS